MNYLIREFLIAGEFIKNKLTFIPLFLLNQLNHFINLRNKLYTALSLLVLTFYSCSDSIINQNNSGNSNNYSKVFTVDSADMKFELWKLNDSILYSGYNDIGFKVFISGEEKKSGFFKFLPLMYHEGGVSHTTPVGEYFYYDEQKSLFTGYVCFLMASDSSTSFWFADFNYNNKNIIKLNQFDVRQAKDYQMRFWVDNNFISYSLTIISPKNPVIGSNEFKCVLHKRDSSEIYKEVDSAEMYINTWKNQDNFTFYNQNPVWVGNGKYSGNINFPGSGKWIVSDSITYRGVTITGNILPKFFFDVY